MGKMHMRFISIRCRARKRHDSREEKNIQQTLLIRTYICPYIKVNMLENKQMLQELDEI